MKPNARIRLFVIASLASVALLSWNCEQNKPAPLQVQSEDPYTTLSKQSVFQSYDEAPEPIGGFEAIQKNLQYPEIARRAGIQGRVILNLLINENGVVDTVKVLKSLGKSGCDEAAVNAAKSVRWKPAINNGVPVKVWVGIPVVFKLAGSKPLDNEMSEGAKRYKAFFENLMEYAEYPAVAEAQNIEGIVVVEVFVDQNGDVIDAVLIEKSAIPEAGFDQAALDLLQNKKWPSTYPGDAKPSQVRHKIRIHYKNQKVYVQPLGMTLMR
jgi:TonB family protein